MTDISLNQREVNLHRNWHVRGPTAIIIGGNSSSDMFMWKDKWGTIVFYLLTNDRPLGYVHCYQYPTYVQINSTYFSEDNRRQGFGTLVYKTIIQTQGKLISDSDLSPGARALWDKLMRDPELSVRNNGFDRFIAVPAKAEIS